MNLTTTLSIAGLYVCTAESWCGSRARSSGVLEVEPRQPPQLQLHPGPGVTTTTGGSVMLQCRCGKVFTITEK